MAARLRRAALAIGALVFTGTPARAQDQATFLVRLGNDTVSAERIVLTGGKLEIDQATRFPRAMRRHAVVTLGADGAVTMLRVRLVKGMSMTNRYLLGVLCILLVTIILVLFLGGARLELREDGECARREAGNAVESLDHVGFPQRPAAVERARSPYRK
jgi:hypothetical protein